MNDLISRKVVLEYLRELCETKDTSAYGLQLMGNYETMKSKIAERDCVKSIIREIESIETAYDVDKVVEQLNELLQYYIYSITDLVKLSDVIDIIKGGGKDE